VRFTILSIICTIAIGFSGNIFLALVLFAIANFGCQGAIVFYNSMMIRVSPEGRTGLVSGLGRMFGYSGAILAIYISKPVLVEMGSRPVFIISGLCFLVFSLPCMLFIKEKGSNGEIATSGNTVRIKHEHIISSIKDFVTGRDMTSELKNFLIASFLCLCAVNTVILFMAIYAGKVFSVDETVMTDLIAFSTLFAILGSIIFGVASDRIGYRRSLFIVFILWGISIISGAFLDKPFHWFIGAMIGLSLGSVWVVSRAMIVKLVPPDRIGTAFGIFNLLAYSAGVIGPLFWGVSLLALSRFGEAGYRTAFLSLIIFVAGGIVFLVRMKRSGSESQGGAPPRS